MIRTLSFVLLAAASVAASAASDTAQPADPRALLRKVNSYCPGGIERILPGEYYFCAAARDFGKNHDARARERLRDAAYWASKPAQYVLGLMYFNGDDGPANRPLGVAWLALASERHDPRFEPAFAKAYLQLSAAEKTQADAYWVDMREKYGDKTAGTRAQRIYLAEMRNLVAASMFGGSIFVDGIAPPNGDPVGSFMGAGGTVSSGVGSGSTGFGVVRMIGKSGDDFFRGLNGTVTVGDAEMVPLGNVVARTSPKAN